MQGKGAGRLSRARVAEQLGVSIGTVRNMEKDGRLHPTMEDGVNLFDPQEIAALKAERERDGSAAAPATSRSEGEIAAACFNLFKEGHTVVDVVQELKLPPSMVRAMLREYLADDADPPRRPTPPPPENLKEQEAEERRWRVEMDREYGAWEKDLKEKWRRPGSPRPRG
jgi:transcriptional regulator with XRE-family HTH domain